MSNKDFASRKAYQSEVRANSSGETALNKDQIPSPFTWEWNVDKTQIILRLKPGFVFGDLTANDLTVNAIVASASVDVESLQVTNNVGIGGYVENELRVDGPLRATSEMLHLQHRLTGINNSGTFTAGAWRRRPINYEKHNSIVGASFDSVNVTFTLPAGYYWLDLYSCAFYVQVNCARLYDVTNSAVIEYGDSGLSNAAAGYNNSGSTIRTFLELLAPTELAVDHYCSTTRTSDGFGYRNSALDGLAPGIYADYKIWKLNE